MEARRATAPSSTTTTSTSSAGGGGRGGVILGKYRLGRLLGRGSFAKVYYARSMCDGNAVAVKVIDKATTVDAAMESRIVREIAAMRRLRNHPNILQIHEVLATKTKIYLVMDLAVGGEITAELSRRRNRRFSEPTARRYFHQLVSALHFCHRHGVSHRDIKPQNLLLSNSGELKISDFGLSSLHGGSDNLLQTACGTPAYAAPEIFIRRGYDGAAADAWSCGVILFVFLSGYLPFDDSNLSAMYKKICKGEFQIPYWVSKQSKHIIRQLLDPNPITRMSLEKLMGHPWFNNYSDDVNFQFCPQLGLELNRECKLTTMNAFDIISMSSGLDLSGLFEKKFRERKFSCKESVEAVEERVKEISIKLGYKVERGKGRSVGLRKREIVLVAEVLVVTEELTMVVVKVVDGDFEGLSWDDFRGGFEEIGLCWHNDVC